MEREWGFRESRCIQIEVTVRALLTLVLMGDICSFNWIIKYINYLRGISQNTKIFKTVGGGVGSVFDNQASRDSRMLRL